MSDIRLDPATLTYLMERVPAARLSCEADYLGGYRTPHEVDVFRHGMSTVHNVHEATLRALLTYAEAGRPPLSEWVRACEGTAFGAPRVRFFDGAWWGLALGRHSVMLASLDDAADAITYAGICVNGERAEWYDSPADLRAALDRLAEEEKKP